MSSLRSIQLALARALDVALAPLTLMGAAWLKIVRRVGLHRMPVSRRLLLGIGLLPVREHYYEPFVAARTLRFDLREPRRLPGLDLNVAEQLSLLEQFNYGRELEALGAESGRFKFSFENEAFKSGDAEFLYSIIRHGKPRRIVEIGSGHSTLVARRAIQENATEKVHYLCDQVCIEPFEQPWLEELDVTVVRTRVESIGRDLFRSLTSGDILFIDSSHMIRPQGDVLVEILEILPDLQSGVFIHFHDIFTPRDYPPAWVLDEARLWNEQYLLEAFLSFNKDFRVIGALNYLRHAHPGALTERFPILAKELASREPGSFWIARN